MRGARTRVILPTFDRANVTVAAVRSVLDRTKEAIEVMVADDGSTDGTQYWCHSARLIRAAASPHRRAR